MWSFVPKFEFWSSPQSQHLNASGTRLEAKTFLEKNAEGATILTYLGTYTLIWLLVSSLGRYRTKEENSVVGKPLGCWAERRKEKR